MKQIAVSILASVSLLGLQGCANPLTLQSNQAAPVEERSTPQLAGRQNARSIPSANPTNASRTETVAVGRARPTNDVPATVYARPVGSSSAETSEQLAPPRSGATASTAPRATHATQGQSLQARPVASEPRSVKPMVKGPREPVVAQGPGAQTAVPQIVPEPPAFPAARKLVAQGDQLRRAGQLEQAAAAYERALEIAPADAWVWHRLAVVRSVQGQSGLARALARRSNALATGDEKVLQANTPYL